MENDDYNLAIREFNEMDLIYCFNTFMSSEGAKKARYSFDEKDDSEYLIYRNGLNWVLDYKYDEQKQEFTNLYDLLILLLWEFDIDDTFTSIPGVSVPVGTNVIIMDDYLGKGLNGQTPELKKGIIVDNIFDSFEAKEIYEIKIGDDRILAVHNDDNDYRYSFKTIEGFRRDLWYEIHTLSAEREADDEISYIREQKLAILDKLNEQALEYKEECLNRGRSK